MHAGKRDVGMESPGVKRSPSALPVFCCNLPQRRRCRLPILPTSCPCLDIVAAAWPAIVISSFDLFSHH